MGWNYFKASAKLLYNLRAYNSKRLLPEQVLEDHNSFLGIHLGSSSLNYFNSNESKKTAAPGFMWSNLTKPILKDNTGKFTKEIDKEEIDIFERVASDVLKENGYRLYSKVNTNRFSQEEISEFSLINEKLKKEAHTFPHLTVDKEFRIDRKKLLEELNS